MPIHDEGGVSGKDVIKPSRVPRGLFPARLHSFEIILISYLFFFTFYLKQFAGALSSLDSGLGPPPQAL